MLMPGLPSPCMAVRHTITRAHWMRVWLRQGPPWPLPQPPDRSFLSSIGAGGRFRIGGPEHDHVAVLQAVLDRAIGLRLADAQRVAPMVHGAPVPAFPRVGIVVHARHADRVGEAEQRR